MEEKQAIKNGAKDKNKNIAEVITHKDTAFNTLNTLLLKYINNPKTIDKADKLSYWIEDYCRMLDFEKDFKPDLFKSYSRGDIVKVNLGYNIGNEEGGLHYCVVIDRHNSTYSGIVTVIPLSSDKGKKLHFSEVNLGNEIYINFKKKYDALLLDLSRKVNSINVNNPDSDKIQTLLSQLHIVEKLNEEIAKMKFGSIALVSQITTISKQRIYNPQHAEDILSGIKISDNSLDLINNKIKQLFVK